MRCFCHKIPLSEDYLISAGFYWTKNKQKLPVLRKKKLQLQLRIDQDMIQFLCFFATVEFWLATENRFLMTRTLTYREIACYLRLIAPLF